MLRLKYYFEVNTQVVEIENPPPLAVLFPESQAVLASASVCCVKTAVAEEVMPAPEAVHVQFQSFFDEQEANTETTATAATKINFFILLFCFELIMIQLY